MANDTIYTDIKDKTLYAGWTYIGTKAVDLLLSKANGTTVTSYDSGNKNQMFVFSHPATNQTTALTDYRYIGNDPYNYVNFSGDTWRIIGVFKVDGVQKVKLIKNRSIGGSAWDTNNSNEWKTSSTRSYLNTDFKATLSEDAKKMISPTTYYLGGANSNTLSATTSYTAERSNTTYGNHSKNYKDEIGLFYVSDYLYTYANGVNASCFEYGSSCEVGTGYSWLSIAFRSWFITPRADAGNPIVVGYNGYVYLYDPHSYDWGKLPVLYLDPDVRIVSGDGTSKSPYELILKK